MTYYSGKEPDFNLNLEYKLPIFDYYINTSTNWIYETRMRTYTGKRYKNFCFQIILFRVAFTWSFDYTKETICPVVAKIEHRNQRIKNAESVRN